MPSSLLRTVVLTGLAITAFAANSVLARLALAGGGIDALGFTGVRMTSGAVVLLLAAMLVARSPVQLVWRSGSRLQAGALFVYAVAASISYALLGAGIGALILFGTVQLASSVWTVRLGERPGPMVWLGLLIAFASLIYLISPSLAAPDPVGVALSVVSGLAWAAYSLTGHRSALPLLDTAGNFLRIAPICAALAILGVATHPATPSALLVAIVCGGLSTGMGYAIWYAALPLLTKMQASIVQLTVPVIAALGAIPIVGEPLTPRFAVSAVATIGGVGLAIVARRRAARPA